MELDPSSGWVCARLGEAALDFALPVRLVVADWEPELDVVLDAHERSERILVAMEEIVDSVPRELVVG